MSTPDAAVSINQRDTPEKDKVAPFVLTSPFDGMDIPWTEEAIAEFNRVLSEYETD